MLWIHQKHATSNNWKFLQIIQKEKFKLNDKRNLSRKSQFFFQLVKVLVDRHCRQPNSFHKFCWRSAINCRILGGWIKILKKNKHIFCLNIFTYHIKAKIQRFDPWLHKIKPIIGIFDYIAVRQVKIIKFCGGALWHVYVMLALTVKMSASEF